MTTFKNLPYTDVDGYYEGLCTVMEGEGIGLPDHVVDVAAPEDPGHYFYKLNTDRAGWVPEKKPTSASECVAVGAVSHTSQTERCAALRELFQKLTEGSTEYHVKRGQDLSWAVEQIPEKTVEEVRTEKTSELDAAFKSWYTDGATMKSSLGFDADSDFRAMQDVNGLVTAAEAQVTFDTDGTLVFMDANNQGHAVTLDQLKVLQLEIINSGNLAYQQKWKIRDAIAKAKTKEELEAITIKFTPADFTAA